MVVDLKVPASGTAAPRSRFVEVLRARGVLVFEGSIFESRNARGVPPEGATTPRVIMRAAAAPLTAKEQAGIVAAVRQEVEDVRAIVEAQSGANPESVDLLEAHYRIDETTGLEIIVTAHGLVDHVGRMSLN
jgi:hypothetical protein